MKRIVTSFALLLTFSAIATAQTPWLHVEGNQIKDPAGNTVILRGVATQDIAQQNLSYQTLNLDELIDLLTDETDSSAGVPGWYPKVIRFTVEPTITDFESYYLNTLKPAVDSATAKGLYVIIDNHFIENIEGNIEYTNEFWTYMAPRFRDYSNVMFEVYNEPINTSMSWSAFKPYMQDWVDLIRQYAPHNLILAGCPVWSQRIGGSATDPLTGGNIVYVVHIYPLHFGDGNTNIVNEVETAAAVHPVFMTEWGFRNGLDDLLSGTVDGYGTAIMDWAESLGISWIAWCADNDWEPTMFSSDWQLLTGNDNMGGFVKELLYNKRTVDQPVDMDCVPPYIGKSQTLCAAPSIELSTDLTPDGKVFTWLRDGDTLAGETGPSLAGITAPGVYKVSVDSNGCVMSDEVNIIDTLFPVTLGPDRAVLSDSIELSITNALESFTYQWYRNGVLLSDTTPVLKILDTVGTVYSVIVQSPGCGTVEDDLTLLCPRCLYLGDSIEIPGRVQAEWYDIQNIPNTSYYDASAGNSGNSALRNDDVDVENCQDVGGGANIGWIDAGEWLEYTIKVTEPGIYPVHFRVASQPGGGRLRIRVSGRIEGYLDIPATGGWQTWQSYTIEDVDFFENDSVIRIEFLAGLFNLNYFTADAPVGIHDGKEAAKISLFPNPTHGILCFETEEDMEWSVVSVAGKELMKGKGKSADLSGLERGTYIVIVNGVAYPVIRN